MNEKEVNTSTELVIYGSVEDESNNMNASVTSISNNELAEITTLAQAIPDNNRVNELHVCEKCNRTFKQKSRYERHIANHPSEKQYLCTTCKKTFTRVSHLEKHTRTHTEERRHICEVCGAAFLLPHHLVRHMLIHTGIRPFECEVCHKQFTRKAGLNQHQFVHSGVRPFICEVDECGKQFTDRTTLRRHMLTHSREKPFICKECDKTFRTKAACRKHYLRHFKGNYSFKCGVCEEMFQSEELLKEHNVVHEPKQKIGVFRCGFCLRVFKTQIDLDSHVPLHETGMVHSCSRCPAKFYTNTDLLTHVQKHLECDYANNRMADRNCFQQSPTARENDETVDETRNENGKVVVVLQLPNSADTSKNNVDENNTSPIQLDSIQQIFGPQIDNLLVSNEKHNDNLPIAVQISNDQRELLKSPDVKDEDSTETNTPNTISSSKQNQTSRRDSAVGNLSPSEPTPMTNSLLVQQTYVLSTVSANSDKNSSSYIVMTPYKERPSNATSPSESLENSVEFSLCSDDTPVIPRKLADSVFSLNKEHTDGLQCVAVKTTSLHQNSSIHKDYQLYESREEYDRATSADTSRPYMENLDLRKQENLDLESRSPGLFSSEYENTICDSNLLVVNSPQFAIVTST